MKSYSIWFRDKHDKCLQVSIMKGESEQDIRDRIAAMADAVLITDRGATEVQMIQMYKDGLDENDPCKYSLDY